MKPVIQVEGLSKKYQIKHQAGGTHYKTLRETITHLPQRLFSRTPKENREEFWALNDVSFDIMPGERVGIIGRNGAGKSTLLKLLSRITEPTKGKITLRGRVASLLEVGTGFHPELTGRENIFLNGAILGMHRSEIQRKFDEIVDFSGVEKFLDTPVKRYSSGMYVRLAFAVAAHLEPEILIVDEVLAVGDAEFQKKCMGKMEEVSQGEGRTVLFVSHNMAMLEKLCPKSMLLHNGVIKKLSTTRSIVADYSKNDGEQDELRFRKDRAGNGKVFFCNIRLIDPESRKEIHSINSGEKVTIEVGYKKNTVEKIDDFTVAIAVRNTYDEKTLFVCYSAFYGNSLLLEKNEGQLECCIQEWPLGPGDYIIKLYGESQGHVTDWIDGALSLRVGYGNFIGTQCFLMTQDVLSIPHEWKLI